MKLFSICLVTMALGMPMAASAQQQSENIGEQAIKQLLQSQSGTGRQDEQTVRRLLEERGYTDVGDVQRVFRTTARRDGRDVTLTIDAETGKISSDRGTRQASADDRRGRSVRNENAVRDLLNDEGYTRVSNVRRQGDQFRADAERDGQQVSLVIDSETGDIRERD